MDLSHGDLENLILNVMWDNTETLEELMSVAQVMEKLNTLKLKKKWAYTTVKTVLDRLFEKGLIDKVKVGKKFVYHTIVSKEEMIAKTLNKIVNDYYDNNFEEFALAVSKMANKRQKCLLNVR